MTPQQFIYLLLGLAAIVVVVFVLIFLVNKLDDETVNMIPTLTRAALNRRAYGE